MLGSRRFTSTPVFNSRPTASAQAGHTSPSLEHDLLAYIHGNVIGKDEVFTGPFGPRKVVYCDYTASGKPLRFIESFIQAHVLPLYGNTHSTVSVTAEQTTVYVHEARDIIRNAVRASEHDVVLFVGAGTTAAVNTLVHVLGLANRAATCIVGPFEHHSNLLPFRESCRRVLAVQEDGRGLVDVSHLRELLASCRREEPDEPIIGAFSACSNVTGVLTNVDRVSEVLHEFDALALWDYASAAPYTHIDMRPMGSERAWKDAVYFSGHKFVGGSQSPGVLVFKKSIVQNQLPVRVGGGTVFFVRRNEHRYLKELENREEGGTPDSIGEIRLGMAFQLKQAVSTGIIEAKERDFLDIALKRWKCCPNLRILGNVNLPRLPIISFVVAYGDEQQDCLFLHHNFVTAILDDVYGVQTRSGCLCAGPYVQELLGINEELAAKYEEILSEDARLDRVHLRRKGEYSDFETLRPGVTRLNLPYFATREEIEFVVESVAQISLHGWKLLPQYRLNPETGEWHHVEQPVFTQRKWLGHIDYKTGRMEYNPPPHTLVSGEAPHDFEGCLHAGQAIFERAESVAKKINVPDERSLFDLEPVSKMRWFLLPIEAKMALLGKEAKLAHTAPFHPKIYSSKPDMGSVVGFFEEIWNSYRNPSERSVDEGRKPGDDFVEKSNVHQSSNNICASSEQQGPSYYYDNVTTAEMMPETNRGEATFKLSTGSYKEGAEMLSSLLTGDVLTSREPELGLTEVSQSSSAAVTSTDDKSQYRENWSQGHRVMPRKPDGHPLRYQWRHPPAHTVFKPMVEAIQDFRMIQDGDKVLVCLSGGKDSLSLLHSLRQYQFYARGANSVTFDLAAVTVDPGSAAYDPTPLIDYLDGLNLTYLYEEQKIFDQAMSADEVRSICAFCSRMKRGRLYVAARAEGWNVLAFGQHLDDLAESFLMSVFYNGALRTIKASYTVKQGDLKVIRPLAYVREKDLRQFAEGAALPVIPENCPACFEAPKQRHKVKQLLASQEVMYPNLFPNILAALKPLMAVRTPDTSAMKSEAVENILNAIGDFHFDDEPE